MEKIQGKIQEIGVFVIGLVLAVFHIYTSYFGALPAYQQRIVHLVFSMMLVPLCYDLVKTKKAGIRLAYQIVLIGALAVIGIYSYSIANDMKSEAKRS